MKMKLVIIATLLVLCWCEEKVENNEVNVEDNNLKIQQIAKAEKCDRRTKSGDVLYVNYNGTLQDGKIFDQNNDEDQPFQFQLGVNQVIKGWDQGLLEMCEGEIRRLVIPPELGYGEKGGFGVDIPPNAILHFDVRLISIEDVPDFEKLFQELDENGDSVLSPEELEKQIRKDMTGRSEEEENIDAIVGEVLQYQDKDKDGVLSKEEFITPPQIRDEL